VTLSGEAGLLGGGRLGVTKHPNHINIILSFIIFPLAFKVAGCRLPRWQQKHHSIP